MRRGLAVLATLVVAGCVDDAGPAAQSGSAPDCRVTDLVDGDTLALSCNGRPEELVRLRGIDAPETEKANCPAEREQGERALQALERLVAGASVTGIRYGGQHLDGRRLVDLEIGGQDVGRAMLASGMAKPLVGVAYPDWCTGQ